MEPTNKSSDKTSELKSLQDNESLLKQLLETVAQDLHQGDVDIEILENHKMSDALREFIEPLSYDVQNDEGFVKLLNLGTIAWNLSFFSKQVARKEIEQMLQSNLLVPVATDKEIKEDLKNILGQLIARKKRHFSSYKRLILDFELKNEGNSFHLFVVSAPTQKKFKQSR